MSRPILPPNDRAPARGVARASLGMLAVRLGLGTVWALNLIFILDPANNFFSGFPATAASYGGSSLVGTGFPAFVSAHSFVFSGLIAGVTFYLAVAFLLGFTTRFASGVGIVFAAALLVSQFGTTFAIPGGTDVGPMPLYIGMYTALLLAGGAPEFSLDAVLGRTFGWRPRDRPVTRPDPSDGRTVSA